MLIPLRAGDEGLVVSWDLAELFGVLPRPNVELERVWAGVLTVVRDSWPDWPVEVWGSITETFSDEHEVSGDARSFRLSFAVFFGGEGRQSKTAAAMAALAASGSKTVPSTRMTSTSVRPTKPSRWRR